MSLVRLLQLASPTLPVGAYSYSQGLEAAIEAGIVLDFSSAKTWIGDVLELSVARMEAPVLRVGAFDTPYPPSPMRWPCATGTSSRATRCSLISGPGSKTR